MLGCAKKQSFDSILSKEPENLRLMAEAKLIFGDILESGASYSSYSSDRVSYEIKDLNLSLEGWLLKNKLLAKKWLLKLTLFDSCNHHFKYMIK